MCCFLLHCETVYTQTVGLNCLVYNPLTQNLFIDLFAQFGGRPSLRADRSLTTFCIFPFVRFPAFVLKNILFFFLYIRSPKSVILLHETDIAACEMFEAG
uniref:Uncharacterized protein n=1 Tax=Micrurus lemniscatus lemniscatus TaxID=129467 RepID=A0A2D4H855_MICLE